MILRKPLTHNSEKSQNGVIPSNYVALKAIKMDRHTDTHWCLFVKKDALIHV